MPNRKHIKSVSEKDRQRLRTHKNKAKKYAKLLSLPHTEEQDRIWKEKLELFR